VLFRIRCDILIKPSVASQYNEKDSAIRCRPGITIVYIDQRSDNKAPAGQAKNRYDSGDDECTF
jgi:hypothetical protein